MRKWETISGFVRVGVMGKTHGAQGELKVHFDESYLETALENAFLFVEVEGNKVPYQVESLRTARGLVAKFYEIDNTSEAAPLIGGDLFLPEESIGVVEEPVSELEYAHLVGYTVQDDAKGLLGIIREVQSYPQQEMAIIDYDTREVLIPLNPVFITDIDDEARLVQVDLPEGLLDQ